MSDKEMIDFLQRDPNPKLTQLIDIWISCEGGMTLRGAIEKLSEKWKDKS